MTTITRLQERTLLRNEVFKRTGYTPHPKQQEFHQAIENGARFIVKNWGRRTGKTISDVIEGIVEMGMEPPRKTDGIQLPKRHVWAVGPTYEVTEPQFEYYYDWLVTKAIFGKPRRESEREKLIEMPWGSRLDCKTTIKPRSMRGMGTVYAAPDEYADCDPETIDKYLIPTLADVGGILPVSSTPQGRLNHFFPLWEDWLKESQTNPLYFASHATSYDNPHIDHEAIEEFRRKCERQGTMYIFRQEVLAEFTAVTGAIFPNFFPDKDGIPWHVQEFERLDLPFGAGVDFNFDKPFGCCFCQKGPDDQIFIWDEIYEPGLDDPAKARAVNAKMSSFADSTYHPFLEMCYCDPSAASGKQTFRNHGLSVWESESSDNVKINDVDNGIDLMLEKFGREDKPGFVIHPRCVNLISELQGYHKIKGRIVKENDHLIDGLRYYNTALYGSVSQPVVMFSF